MSRLGVFLSRISFRLLAFNLLLVIIPFAGFLFLDTYEKQLLSSQEESMVQQGRILSAALAQTGPLSADRAEALLKRLQGRTVSRLRIVDGAGNLLADSSVLFGPEDKEKAGDEDLPPFEKVRKPDTSSASSVAESGTAAEPGDWLYQFFTGTLKFFRDITGMPRPELGSADYYSKDKPVLGPEVKAALEGRYGATTRFSIGEQRRSIIIYSAIPVRSGDSVVGAVLVSQSTYRLLLDLYEVRMGTLKISLFCIVLAVVLSLFLSSTIGRPIRRLRNEAEAVLDTRGRLTRPFQPTRRLDEIGDLGRALRTLTERLEAHIQFIESFAADLSHEFKNPLASIRAATEISMDAAKEKERVKFLSMVLQDVARMERLLSGAREITQIDVSIAKERRGDVALGPLLEHIIAGARLREKELNFLLVKPDKPVLVAAREERLAQVFENILDNAISFSPAGGTIEVVLGTGDRHAVIAIRDEGPGIPPEHREKIFERFFTFRPGSAGNSVHTGLGLSIVKVIVQGYEGTVQAKDSPKAGALFEIRLPLYEKN